MKKSIWIVVGLVACLGIAPLAVALDVPPAPESPQAAPAPQAPPPAPGQQQGGMMRRSPGPGFGGPAPMAAPMARPDLGKWWKNSEIAQQIGLSETQINQIEQTFYNHRLQLIDLNADVQRNEARLQPLMEADAVDETKISAQLDQLLAARSRLEKANMMMMISIRKVLTIEQWKKLEEIRERREGMHMRGQGMMMRQGPGPEPMEFERMPSGPSKRPAPPRPPEDERP